MIRFLGLLAILAVVSHGLLAEEHQPYAVPGSSVHDLKGNNGVSYRLYVRFPKGYEKREGKYATIYMLDADYSFPLVHAIAEHFEDRNNMPRVILVGLAYPGAAESQHIYRLNRTRDYTPTLVPQGGYGAAYQKYSGGAAAFRDVLKSQIFPFIKSTYAASDSRTLIGHSYGGLFTTFVMLTDPKMFDRYLVVSPSLWYDDKMIFSLQAAFTNKPISDLRLRAFYSVGSFEEQPHVGRAMVSDLRAFHNRMSAYGFPGYFADMHVFEGETHNSVFPAAVSRGLRFLFRN